jgi:ATP-dependent helicase/DNAse subunit B
VINLLLAPAAHGKTQHALARIRAVRAEHPLTPIVVILPNHTQLAEFRRRFAALGGALGVSLFTFYGLYAELLARAGQPYPELDDPAQARLIRALVDDLAERGVLTHFAPLRARSGFAAALREAIEELKRARVFPEDFAAATRASPERSRRRLGPRLEELAEIYSAYQRWLHEKNWADPEGLGWLAAEALEKDKTPGRDLRLLVVDGFDEFNPTQLAVLAHLAARANETLITLTGDPQRQRLAHRRFHRAQQQLTDALKPEIVWQVEGGGWQVAEPLSHLETRLFEPSISNLQSPISNTASHNGPHMRSRIDVCSKNERTGSG